VQENQAVQKMNGPHQFLAYADDVNLLGDNIDTIKKNTKKTLIDDNMEVSLELNVEKTKYILQNAGKNHDMMANNRSLRMQHSSHVWKGQQQIRI
jgi:hypothetical protein